MTIPDLHSIEFLKGLKKLNLVSKHNFAGQKIGDRKTKRKGASVEFKDYKEYNPGDDIRFIDWNLWGRLDRFYIKLFYNEENLNVHFLLDASQSMLYGSPSKWNFALQFIAGTAFLALHQKDHVNVYPIQENLFKNAPKAKSPGKYSKLVNFLEKIEPGGGANLIKSVDQFIKFERNRGIVFFVSDFLTEEKTLDYCLRKLAYYRHDVSLVQILSPQEENPNIYGNCILQDFETNQEMNLIIDDEYYTIYHETLEEHKRMVNGLCKKYNLEYSYAKSEADFKNFIIRLMRKRL